MTTLFIIWLVGYIVLFALLITILIKTGEDISLGDLIRAAFVSITSWAMLIVMLIEYTENMIIYKRKKK